MKCIVIPDMDHNLLGEIRFNFKIYSSVIDHFHDTINRKALMTTLKDIKLGQKCLIKNFYGYTGPAWVIGLSIPGKGMNGVLLGWKEKVHFKNGGPHPYALPEYNWLFKNHYTKVPNYDEFCYAFATSSVNTEAELLEIVETSCWNTTCSAKVHSAAYICYVCNSERPKR